MRKAEEIIQVAVERLVLYARNAPTHDDAEVARIAASIREFGFTGPVLVDGTDGIIAGHGRVMAARKLGLDSVPCIRVDYLTEAQERAYILADNKLNLESVARPGSEFLDGIPFTVVRRQGSKRGAWHLAMSSANSPRPAPAWICQT